MAKYKGLLTIPATDLNFIGGIQRLKDSDLNNMLGDLNELEESEGGQKGRIKAVEKELKNRNGNDNGAEKFVKERKANVIAPNDKKSLVAMEKMAADIEKARELYGDGEPFDEERVLDCIAFKAEQSSSSLNSLAKYCLWLKAEVGHGRFMDGLKRRNINYYAANWAMLIYEKLGSNFATLQNLGSSKARYLTYFSKEEIDKYAEGGPLGNIPHDDVSEMTVRELEAEVRKLREKTKRLEDVSKEKIRQKDEQITSLELEIKTGCPLTEKEKKEKAAQKILTELKTELFANINLARGHFKTALRIIATARQLEGVTFPMLKNWADAEYFELEGFNELFEQLDNELVYIHVDKGDGKRA